MLKVYICEDIPKQLEHLRDIIDDIIDANNLDMEMYCYTSDPVILEKAVKSNFYAGIYFLDIYLNAKIDGFEVAEFIRKYDLRGFIVFVTIDAQSYLLTMEYGFEALGYIVKTPNNDLRERLSHFLLLAQRRMMEVREQRNEILRFKASKIWHAIDYKNIISLEIDDENRHRIVLYAINERMDFYGTLTEIEKNLDERFVRIDKSTIINIEMIEKFDYRERKVIMYNKGNKGTEYQVNRKVARILDDKMGNSHNFLNFFFRKKENKKE